MRRIAVWLSFLSGVTSRGLLVFARSSSSSTAFMWLLLTAWRRWPTQSAEAFMLCAFPPLDRNRKKREHDALFSYV